MTLNNILMAFGLTLFAGLATGVGSALAFFTKKTNTKFLSVSLGFSAGVMIYVSFVEIFFKAKDSLILELGEKGGTILTVVSFFAGMFLIGLIDKFVPSFENPHEARSVEDMDEFEEMHKDEPKDTDRNSGLLRMGYMSAIAIAIHNFPEGIATFVSAMNDPALGVTIAVAIGIHNIPEGIAVAIPIYYATRSRKKAFWYSLLSGLAEPLGAVVGYFMLAYFFHESFMGIILAGVSGIMVYISLDELLPTAEKYGEHHPAIIGVIAGMAVMGFSLLII